MSQEIAFIFDMDGLLLDTERLAYQAFQKICSTFNFVPEKTIYERCIGTTQKETERILQEGYGGDFPWAEIHRLWFALYEKEIEEGVIPIKQGVFEILEFAQKHQIPQGVATSTRFALAQKKLKKTGLLRYFSVLVGGDQVAQGKPHPEIYLKTAQLLKKNPAECFVFEDSDHGVKAALSAGMRVFQIPDLKEIPAEQQRLLGHTICTSLKEAQAKIEAFWTSSLSS